MLDYPKKTCKRCDVVKKIYHFPMRKNKSDNHSDLCHDCTKATRKLTEREILQKRLPQNLAAWK